MQTFLQETAAALYDRYGEGISERHLVFPSRRARLFFNDALSALAGRPLWQPRYRSLDELMETAAGMRKSDSVRLLAELYAVYSAHHPEPFNRFYAWGEMLLADFDQIDKYRIDAAALFVNIAELKDLEGDLSYLTAEQRTIIRRFWRHFDDGATASPEKQHFSKVWNTLLPIYREFRERLETIGLAYPGMIYRAAADRMKADRRPQAPAGLAAAADRPAELEELLGARYALIGFNALSETEKILFDYLQQHGAADFFWDYDTYYTDDPEQEAGLFLRENLRRYPPANRLREQPAGFVQPKEIVAVATPSDAMQTRYVARFLEELAAASGRPPGRETVVVLTDENLLAPVLHAIPESVGRINVTMGYPLRRSAAYAFTERLIELQLHKKTKGGATLFYHAEVTGLLDHPWLRAGGMDTGRLLREITDRRQIYVPAGRLDDGALGARIFRPVEGWEALSDYLTDILTELAPSVPTQGELPQAEFFAGILEHIYRLQNTLRQCGLALSDSTFLSLLRKNLQSVRVPYEGEPLEGVQVMGILETRNLDFENVVILPMNDDTFPGNLSGASSFIPGNLRLAYGLPTPQHHEGVYGYYFYRLLQRARRVHLVWSVKTDDKKTGEPSRYVYQLDYESPHRLARREMALNIHFPPPPSLVAAKDAAALARLGEYLGSGARRRISPSLLYSYIECPLKFYYRAVAGLRQREEIDEEIDLPMFGTIFHKAAELIYSGLKGDPEAARRLKGIRGTPAVEEAVRQAVIAEYFNGDPHVRPADFGGNLTLTADIVRRYLDTCLLAWDAATGPFEVRQTEHEIGSCIDIPVAGRAESVRLGGIVDRLDVLADGTLRVVDYKTGQQRNEFKGIDALFSPVHAERNPAVLQTLLYAWMAARESGRPVVPALYFIRFMNRPDYSPAPVAVAAGERGRRSGQSPIRTIGDCREALEERLTRTLSDLFDPRIPFSPCEDRKTCEYCPFREVCGR
jgi:hypothetical protein